MKMCSIPGKINIFIIWVILLSATMVAEQLYIGYFRNPQPQLEEVAPKHYIFSDKNYLPEYPVHYMKYEDFKIPAAYRYETSASREHAVVTDSLLQQISAERIESRVNYLTEQFINSTGVATRASGQADSAGILIDSLIFLYFEDIIINEIGYDSLCCDTVSGSYPFWMGEEEFVSRNIYFTEELASTPTDKYLITAHFDCISEPYADHDSYAPGADDNAAGVAALLEIAAIAHSQSWPIDFAIFGANEQGFAGSIEFAQKHAGYDKVYNIDGIGYHGDSDTAGIKVSSMGMWLNFSDISAVMDTLIMGYGLNIRQFEPDSVFFSTSDAWPFLQQENQEAYNFYSGVDNYNWHTILDIPDSVNYEHIAEVTKLILLAVVNQWKPELGVSSVKAISKNALGLNIAPTPFNITTRISFDTGGEQAGDLSIYNIRGQLIKTWDMSQNTQDKGTVVWDGTNSSGQTVSSGVYMCRISLGDGSQIAKRMILCK